MINCIVYDGFAEVSITGDIWAEFEQDRSHFKKLIDPKDRKYINHKKIWQVKNLEKYTRVPFIQKAILEAKQQLKLFSSDVGLKTL